MSQFDAFFSYNREDQLLVKQIANELKEVGIKVWIDENNIPGGTPWSKAMVKGIKDSGTTVVFIGPSGMGKWQMMEVNKALDLNVKQDIPIIPVILLGVEELPDDLPPFLDQFNWIDLRCMQASQLNLIKLMEALKRKRIVISIGQIADEFLLSLPRPDNTERFIKIYTLPNPNSNKLLNLTWETFGIGIENLHEQITNYGYRIHFDACIGINDSGLIMSTFLNSAAVGREKLGYIRYTESEKGRPVSESHSFFPELKKPDPTIMLFDFEVKSGNNLKTSVNRIRQEYRAASIYFAVFGALTDRTDLKIRGFQELLAAEKLAELDITDYFIACTMNRPGIEPPLGLK